MLYSQYGVKYYSLSDDDIRIAHQFILASNHAIQPKLLETTTDDFLFFEVLLMLTWVRRENNVELQDWEDLAALKQLFIYQQLVDYVHLNLEQSLNTFFNQTNLTISFYVTAQRTIFSFLTSGKTKILKLYTKSFLQINKSKAFCNILHKSYA